MIEYPLGPKAGLKKIVKQGLIERTMTGKDDPVRENRYCGTSSLSRASSSLNSIRSSRSAKSSSIKRHSSRRTNRYLH